MTFSTASIRRRWKYPQVRLVAIAVAFLGAFVVIFFAGSSIAVLNNRAETEAVFTDSAKLPDELLDAVSWQPDPAGLPRDMDPITREAVTVSWLRAWEQLSIVSATGDTIGVESYFSNDSRTAVLANSSTWGNRTVRQRGHELALTFFSEDGQVLAMDVSSVIERGVYGVPDAMVHVDEDYEVVMLLEDGNWRVQHMVRRSAQIVEPDDETPDPVETTTGP